MAAEKIITPEDELPTLVLTSFDQLRFLVIDDEPSSLDLMEALLKSLAVADVSKAASVFAGVGILADSAGKFDGIICDQRMDGMTGLALLQRIRAGRNSIVPRDIRFIIMTADPSEEVVRLAFQLDVSGFLTKPIAVTAVAKTLHLAFGRAQRLRPAADYAKIVLPPEGKAEVRAN